MKAKITKANLRPLLKKNKSEKEIASILGCTQSAVSNAKSRWGWGIRTNAQIKKAVENRKENAVKKELQAKIFSEVNIHATTAQGMIDELGAFISDNISIKNELKKKINEAKQSKDISEEIDRYYEAQDKVVQRMEDYRNLQKDLMGIVELQKFVSGVVEAYKQLPLEQRKLFNDELKKRNIVSLTIEQLVESGDDSSGNRPVPHETEQAGNAVPVIAGQEQTILEGTRLLEGQESGSD